MGNGRVLDIYLKQAKLAIDENDKKMALQKARDLGNYLQTETLFKVSSPNLKKIGTILAKVAMIGMEK